MQEHDSQGRQERPEYPPPTLTSDSTGARRRLRVAAVIALALVVISGLVAGGLALGGRWATPRHVPAVRASHAAFHDFALPTANSKPFDITLGHDGALWFTEFDGNKIGRITTAGVITEYTVPTVGASPYMVTAGPGKTIWFTEYYSDKIGRVAPDGTITEFALPGANSSPLAITAGPDDSLWVTAYPGEIVRVSLTGAMKVFPLPVKGSVPFAITAGPDGALWFTYDGESVGRNGASARHIGRMTIAGVVTEFATLSDVGNADSITSSPDGALWFTDYGANRIGSLAQSGATHFYPSSAPYNALNALAVGPDGALWFTRQDGVVGRITTDGSASSFTIPTSNSQPDGITRGPGQTVWFTEMGANRVGYLTL